MTEKKTELLAPAGNKEALIAAISNGCDAIYLGMQKFGARAYSSNFDLETLKESVAYAHLRKVKIYVTMNTIVFENEIQEMKEQMRQLNEIGVDGIIVQDLAALDFLVENFLDMEAHCSTQMGIDDLEGTLLMKDLGAHRVVLAREVEIEKIKAIKQATKMPLEIFVHGALCISYSGNCLMSGLIGYRSGNRGRCVGSCRKPYELVDRETGESLGKSYILSTKDLNTLDHIEDLKEIDSLKIEGRMKETAYVANVVSHYRAAIDGNLPEKAEENLSKTFNRTFTKGFIFHEDPQAITNVNRPNNHGYEVGKISKVFNDRYEIKLTRPLNQNDIIRISHGDEDVVLTVVKMYNPEGDLVNQASDLCYIKIKEKLSKGDRVYVTKDHAYYKALESTFEKEFRRFKLDLKVMAYGGSKLRVEADGLGFHAVYESEEPLAEAINQPTTKEQAMKQLSRLKDTIFELHQLDFQSYNAFIPAKLLNTARRAIVQHLYDLKGASEKKRTKVPPEKEKISFPVQRSYLTASVSNQEQYHACLAAGIEPIYFENVVRRNQNVYKERQGELLIGGYGGIYYYQQRNPFVTDYSLNVVNADTCYTLHRLGAKRVTLSYELNKKQIEDLICAYHEKNHGYPALEMIVYGKAPLLFTKYCPLKKMGQCGHCRGKQYEIKDEHGSFPILCHEDCSSTILNGKNLNLLDELENIKGVEAFRLNFTTETQEQVTQIIDQALGKLKGSLKQSVFNKETDTRGHFNKEIL